MNRPSLLCVLAFVFLFISTTSCSDNEPVNSIRLASNPIKPFALIDAISRGAETTIQLTNAQTDFGQGPEASSTFFSRISTSDNGLFPAPSVITMNEKTVFPLEENYTTFPPSLRYKTLFGSELTLGYQPVSVLGDSSKSAVLDLGYVPMPLALQLPIDYTTINNDYELRWNADHQNENGVYITISYTVHLNAGEVFDQHPESCDETIRIEDSKGKYVFDRSDFECIPTGAIVMVAVMRGMSLQVEDSTGKTKALVKAYSRVSGIARFYPNSKIINSAAFD